MESDDGDSYHLRTATDCHLLRVPAAHELWTDYGRGQGLEELRRSVCLALQELASDTGQGAARGAQL